jgi:Ca2+-binding RTX toxin-like protein
MPAYAFNELKWPSTTVTWSFVNGADQVFSGAITDPEERSLVAQALAKWESVSGLHFVQVADAALAAGTAGIRIGFGDLGGGDARRVLGLTDAVYSKISGEPLLGPFVRLEDPALLPLQADASGALAYQGTSAAFYAVVLHEIGHALGLGHVADPAALMYETASADVRNLGAGEVAGIQALFGPPPRVALSVTDTASGASSQPEMAIYLGPVTYLLHQHIHAGDGGVSMAATAPSVFLRGGGGDDALRVASGSNVLDGGTGSNFLVGGSGFDTFFLDGRGGRAVWSTVGNAQEEDRITLWGWQAGVSTLRWLEAGGTPGHLGATLHADLDGDGDTDASLTLAGLSLAQLGQFSTISAGDNYLTITFA